ncbi:MAG: M1 family peptidase, partial [Saprospiraceae bacterium]
MNRTLVLLAFFTLPSLCVYAQSDRWQQRMDCQMRIEMDVQTHRYRGFQKLTLYNNSPDTLDKLFYHLYFNAFKPGSMMDVRAWELSDG